MPFACTAGERARAAISGARHEPLWLDDPRRPVPRPPAVGDLTADLAVIGGGFAGLWTALRAIERDPGVRVVLLEGERIGGAQSGRNGGFVDASLTHGGGNGLARWPSEFSTLVRLGKENLAGLEATIARYGIDCDYARTGDLSVATEAYQVADLRDIASSLTAAGDPVDFLDWEQVRALVDSPTYLAAVREPDVGLVNPARLCWGLADAAEAGGAAVYEGSPVLDISRDGPHLVLRTDTARVRAARVALAGGAHRPLLRRLSAYVVPVFDHVVATAPLPPEVLAGIGWRGREGISDAGNQFHYYRLTADDRIVWGGYDAVYQAGERPGSALERDDELTARLVQHLHDTFPQVAEVPITHTWAGAIDTCSRFSPFWGRAHSDQLAYVSGFTGLGVGSSRFAADVMLDLLMGERTERTELQMVRSKPLPFPPEPARTTVINLTRRALAAADTDGGRRNLWLRSLDRLGLGFDS